MKPSDNPLLLLIGTGAMLGLNFPLGKIAVQGGITPAVWAAFISFSAGTVMLALSLWRSTAPPLHTLTTFSLFSGFLSYVMPNLLTFTVIPRIGSGLAGLMFALSPVTTALLSLALKVHPPSRNILAGVALGLIGAVLIMIGKSSGEVNVSLWLLLGLAIPCFLAVGNVYRTKAWPKAASPSLLAGLTNLAAVPWLIVIAAALGALDLGALAAHPLLCFTQLIVSVALFSMFFRLQQIGGPTYLSQIGYVAAAVGLIAGVFYFKESYPLLVWLGAGLILVGVLISTRPTRS